MVGLLGWLLGWLVVPRRFVVLTLFFTIVILALLITLLVNPVASIVTIPRAFFLGVTVEASSEGEGFVFWVEFMMNLPERLVRRTRIKDQSNVSMTNLIPMSTQQRNILMCIIFRADKRKA